MQQYSRVLCGRVGVRQLWASSISQGSRQALGGWLTLAEQGVLWQIPEGRLYHLKVSAAQAVHEGGQKVSSDAARDMFVGHYPLVQEARQAPVSPYALTPYCLAQLTWGDSGPRLGLYLPGVVLDGAQCQAEGQVAAGLLR